MEVFHFTSLDSTQAKARALVDTKEMPFIVLADKQDKGRGTKGRSWQSPLGGLYFTLVCKLKTNVLKIDTENFAQELCLKLVETLKKALEDYFGQENLKELSIKPIRAARVRGDPSWRGGRRRLRRARRVLRADRDQAQISRLLPRNPRDD